MRAARRFVSRILNAAAYWWHSFLFNINNIIDETIINRDKVLRSKIQGVAISTGKKLNYSEDEVSATAKRSHKLEIPRDDVAPPSLKIDSSSKKASKIIHVVNLFIPAQKNQSLYHRTSLTLESIEQAAKSSSCVQLLGCSSVALKKHGWKTRILIRNAANTIQHTKDFLFLKDMLDAAAELASDSDYIVYSNLDCPITNDFYNNLLEDNSDIVEYIRRDCPSAKSLEDLFKGESWPYTTGRDAFAFKKKTYLSIREYIPDFIIGEPHWDTALSGICQKLHTTTENIKDVYHIDHPKEWDINSLTIGGQYNQSLFSEAKANGLTDINLLSVEKKTGVIIYNDTGSKFNIKKLAHFIDRHMDCDIAIIDLVKSNKQIREDLFDCNYYPIMHKGNKTQRLDQELTLKNIGMHLLNGFEKIKFISLKSLNKNDYKGETYRSEGLEPFDYFSTNKHKHKNITKISYINDDGLLELC